MPDREDRNVWYCMFCGISLIPVGSDCPHCGRERHGPMSSRAIGGPVLFNARRAIEVAADQVTHEATTGEHTHDHAAFGAGDSDDGIHGHLHTHHNDAEHSHAHAGNAPTDTDIHEHGNARPPGKQAGNASARMVSPQSGSLWPAQRAAINNTIAARNEANR